MRFVLIDRLVELDLGTRAVAEKTFAPEDPLFADHFPGFPVVPGVLLTEAIGQTGGWLLAATLNFTRWPLLIAIERAKFRRLVEPGEQLRLVATLRPRRAWTFEVDGEGWVGERRVAEARLLLHAFDPPATGAQAEGFVQWTRETYRALGGDALGEPSIAPAR